MFTFARKRVGKMFASSATAAPPRSRTRPRLEVLEDRTLLSASPLPAVFEASPPASPSVEVISSYIFSMMELKAQMIATIEQSVIGAYQALGQDLAQAFYSVQQQWDNLLGMNPSSPNPTPGSTAIQNGSASDGNQGHASGSGSGSGTMTTGHDDPQPSGQATPLTGGGGSGNGSGNGSGSVSATVSGQVWLDNNGDGSIDDNELGYDGATVNLWYYDNGTWDLYATTTTNEYGNYSFHIGLPYPSNNQFEMQVVFPTNFEATFPGTSQIKTPKATPPCSSWAQEVRC